MGDVGEDFKFYREIKRQQREKRNSLFEPLIKNKGGIFKSDGVYEYNGWFLYPYKGYGMKKDNYRFKKPIQFILKRY